LSSSTKVAFFAAAKGIRDAADGLRIAAVAPKPIPRATTTATTQAPIMNGRFCHITGTVPAGDST
jgi:hypothetical protein